MNNIKFLLIGLIVGILIPSISNVAIQAFAGTKIYELKKDIQLQNGITITKETKMFKSHSMPEGFDTFMVYINIPRSQIKECFKVKKDKRSGLVIPYWIK